ncbi:MAG: hypothetical protein QM715_19125 [Nibricoccus sp.]
MKRNLAVIAALALCALAHGQTSSSNSTQSPATGENTLESARRELKELPALERSRDVLGKHPGLGSAGLPTLTLPGDAGNSTARPDPDKPISTNWLQDALNQTDAEAATRRRSNDSSLVHERDQGGGYKPVEAPNPLGQFMAQWISPRDLELLQAGQDTKKSNGATDPFVKSWEPLRPAGYQSPITDVARSPLSEPNDTPLVPILAAPRNPYIEEPDSTPPPSPNLMLSPAALGRPQPDRSRGPESLSSLPVASPSGPNQPATLKPAATPVAEPQRPPTAPIVDDRKYFPQLRRF